MARITNQGINPSGLTVLVERFETALKTVFGSDLNLSPETPQGQIAGVEGLIGAELEELALHVGAGLNIETAAGRQISDWGTLFSLPKIGGERSSVTATLTGTSGTLIPKGSRARTTGNAVFASDARAIIETGGTVDVLMRAVDIGPVPAAIGELSGIFDAIIGWTAITNAAAAVLGRNIETDEEYRRRYRSEVATHGRDSLEAVCARVLEQEGVTDCLVRDNSTSADVTVQGVAIAANSMIVIVQGGAHTDIAAAIAETKPAGTPTVGAVTVQVPRPQGFIVPIKFTSVTEIPVTVAVTLTARAGFPSSGLATMRRNLVEWFSGIWPVPGPGLFHQAGVGIGESIDLARLNTPLNAVPGHTLGTVTVLREGGAALGAINLDQRFTLVPDDITLTLS